MRNNKTVWTIIVLVIILLGGMFYWFAYRPSTIKRICAEAVKRGSIRDLAREFGRAKDINEVYSNCLHIKGL